MMNADKTFLGFLERHGMRISILVSAMFAAAMYIYVVEHNAAISAIQGW